MHLMNTMPVGLHRHKYIDESECPTTWLAEAKAAETDLDKFKNVLTDLDKLKDNP
jgi:hypothetical protein